MTRSLEARRSPRGRRLAGSTVAIIGLGRSGEAAARLTHSEGGSAYVSDSHTGPGPDARRDELQRLGIPVDLGRHDLDRIAAADLVVVSPGIPPHAEVLRALHDRGLRWISEPEFAARFLEAPLIVVTGTNGKTTTAAMIGTLLEAGGLRGGVGGNIGAGLGPPASAIAEASPPPDWAVWELSSFQLADVETLAPQIGVVTNLAPDHLDRYENVDAYYADKGRLFENATDASQWVLGRSEAVEALIGEAAGARYWVASADPGTPGGFLRDGRLVIRLESDEEDLGPEAGLGVLGAHNALNALAASLAARLAGVGTAQVRSGLASLRPLPHRLEAVAQRDGVLSINDSKATNVAAARSAVLSVDRPLVVLVGGKDKDEELTPLVEALEGRARIVLAFGAAGGRFEDALTGRVPVERLAGDFESVLRRAAQIARDGDAVLLAPACSSFDMFRDYEERGERFRAFLGGGDPWHP